MIYIAIGIFVCIQIVVLVFTLGLCRSAAISDRQQERAFLNMSNNVEWVDNPVVKDISPDTKPSAHLGYSSTDS